MSQTRLKTQSHRIVHLGLGSFHRAHFAVYMQALLDAGRTDWELQGGNIRNDMVATMAALQAQNGAYTLETITPQGVHSYKTIRAISKVIAYDEQLSGLIEAAASPITKIISFTVTEAGYYLDSQDQLDTGFEDLRQDINLAKAGNAGATIYGALTAILRQRMSLQSGPVTLMNCDNLRHNGARFRKGLLQFIQLIGDAALAEWVNIHTRCPNAMVDRITPRPKPDVLKRVQEVIGKVDGAALMAESFIQWVIEDNFAAERPAFETVGVQLVKDVAPFEEAKIRILNASHSCIAWAGTLLGDTYIHEATDRTMVKQWAHDYVTNDVMPCLVDSPIDLASYRDVVLDRFANPAIEDTNQRVAMDGFSKIPGFIAPTMRQALAAGRSIDSVALLPALFLMFLHRWHVEKLPYEYQDQAMDEASAHDICNSSDTVLALASNTVLWGELAGDTRLVEALRRAYEKIQSEIH